MTKKSVCWSAVGLFIILATEKSMAQFRFDSRNKKCVGKPDSIKYLSDFGVTLSQLEKGLDCLSADFDQNGYRDFVFFKKREVSEEGGYYTQIILMKKSRVLLSIPKTIPLGPLDLYKKTSSQATLEVRKRANCPHSPSDVGLVTLGEGAADHVYMWDKGTNDFAETVCGGEDL